MVVLQALLAFAKLNYLHYLFLSFDHQSIYCLYLLYFSLDYSHLTCLNMSSFCQCPPLQNFNFTPSGSILPLHLFAVV